MEPTPTGAPSAQDGQIKIREYVEKNDIYVAAKKIGIQHSTLTRYLAGGQMYGHTLRAIELFLSKLNGDIPVEQETLEKQAKSKKIIPGPPPAMDGQAQTQEEAQPPENLVQAADDTERELPDHEAGQGRRRRPKARRTAEGKRASSKRPSQGRAKGKRASSKKSSGRVGKKKKSSRKASGKKTSRPQKAK